MEKTPLSGEDQRDGSLDPPCSGGDWPIAVLLDR